jgi:hypothetical protein
MKFELYRDGALYMTIETTGGDMDLTLLPKSVVRGSALSPKSFEELFYKCTRESTNYVGAYEKAEQLHEEYFGCRRYSSYDSFRNTKK